MAFSGGTFSRTFDCTTDRDNGVKILASKFDTELDGFATGLSTCILKDGTQTCTAAIPFAEGLTVPDNKTIILGTNSDITIQYDESTNDSLEIAANVEGAALGIVLKADQGDDNADQHKLNIADGGTLTLGSKISGSFVNYLTHTPNSTVASSTTAVAGNLTVGGDLTLGSGAVISEAELEAIDGVTAGTVTASKAVIVDSNKDIASFRNVTLTGELDAGSLDISGDADIDGTLEADAMTLNGTAITATATLDTGISNNNVPKFTSGVADDDFLRVAGTAIEGRSASEVLSDIGAAPAAGSSNIVTTGALNSGSITSGFGSIDNGSSAITTTGVISGGTLEATADTSAGDNAAIGFTSAEGLILTGQGSTSDITVKNDADATVFSVPTGTTGISFPDNSQAIFGTGGDLTITHDGSDSIIADVGSGNLQIRADDFYVMNGSSEVMIRADTDSFVKLFFDNAEKLATTSTGVDVTGTVTADGLTMDTSANSAYSAIFGANRTGAGTALGLIKGSWNGTTVAQINLLAGSDTTNKDDGRIQLRTSNSGGSVLNRFQIDENGDASFYADDGSTQALFFDASTQRLGLGTTSPEGLIGLPATASNTPKFRLQSASTNTDFAISSYADANGTYVSLGANHYLNSSGNDAVFETTDKSAYVVLDARNNGMVGFGTNSSGVATERMRIDSSGNVGIGTTTTTLAGAAYRVGVVASNNVMAINRTSGNQGTAIAFINENNVISGYIYNLTNSTSYSTTSDYRLKTAVNYDWDATTRLKQLRPARFEWIADGDDAVPVDGFLAHEVQDIVPEAISGTHNEVDDDGNPVYQGIDQSKLTPLLTKALIEAVEKIEQLETRLAALEAN